MRKAQIYIHGNHAGEFQEVEKGRQYRFKYTEDYSGPPISLSMPIQIKVFEYQNFPPFFDGLLPEGGQLEGLLRINKIDRTDYFSQLLAVGEDLVGAVTVEKDKVTTK